MRCHHVRDRYKEEEGDEIGRLLLSKVSLFLGLLSMRMCVCGRE